MDIAVRVCNLQQWMVYGINNQRVDHLDAIFLLLQHRLSSISRHERLHMHYRTYRKIEDEVIQERERHGQSLFVRNALDTRQDTVLYNLQYRSGRKSTSRNNENNRCDIRKESLFL
jgi:hypothetical protein